jgi:hypothetical protein
MQTTMISPPEKENLLEDGLVRSNDDAEDELEWYVAAYALLRLVRIDDANGNDDHFILLVLYWICFFLFSRYSTRD